MPYKENLEKGDYMNIFISYSHIDKEFALKLSSALEADGYDVFIDNKIPIGNNIYKDIGKGIAKADAVIVVISKNSNGSHFVANETISMLSFLDKGRIPLVIPVNLKDIKASLNKENLKTSEDNVISVSIDSVSKNLQDSKEIIENALLEIEKQKKLFEQMKQEAEISQQITTMNQEQVNALNTLLENTLNKQEKKTFPKTLLWNLFFCLLSAILGYILGKLL